MANLKEPFEIKVFNEAPEMLIKSNGVVFVFNEIKTEADLYQLIEDKISLEFFVSQQSYDQLQRLITLSAKEIQDNHEDELKGIYQLNKAS